MLIRTRVRTGNLQRWRTKFASASNQTARSTRKPTGSKGSRSSTWTCGRRRRRMWSHRSAGSWSQPRRRTSHRPLLQRRRVGDVAPGRAWQTTRCTAPRGLRQRCRVMVAGTLLALGGRLRGRGEGAPSPWWRPVPWRFAPPAIVVVPSTTMLTCRKGTQDEVR